jgi:hypothetical protein
MSPRRDDDSPGRQWHIRSDRVVAARDQWYVLTRERMDVGPFETRDEALEAAAQIAQALDGVDDPAVVLRLIREFGRVSRKTVN